MPDEPRGLLVRAGIRDVRLSGPRALARSIPIEVLRTLLLNDYPERFLDLCYGFDSNPAVCGRGLPRIGRVGPAPTCHDLIDAQRAEASQRPLHHGRVDLGDLDVEHGDPTTYIHLYTRLHRRPPAEADIQQYFRVSPPSVHQMVLTLEGAGFITRQPGAARSIDVLVDPELLPELL